MIAGVADIEKIIEADVFILGKAIRLLHKAVFFKHKIKFKSEY